MQHVNKYHAGAIHFMEEDNAFISCLLMNHVAVYCLGWGKCAFLMSIPHQAMDEYESLWLG